MFSFFKTGSEFVITRNEEAYNSSITRAETMMTCSSCPLVFLLVFQIMAQRHALGITSSPKARQLPGNSQIALNNSALKTWINSSTIKFQNDGRKIGILIEKVMYSQYKKAMLFHNSSLQQVKLLPEVVENNPYDVLQAMCNNFTGKGVSGLAFICDEPCSEMASFATLLGWSGVVVKGRSNERSPIFPVSLD